MTPSPADVSSMKRPFAVVPAKAALLCIDLQEEHRQDQRLLAVGFDGVLANVALLQQAAQTGTDKWTQFFFLFRHTLDNMLEGCRLIGFDWRYRYRNAVAARPALADVTVPATARFVQALGDAEFLATDTEPAGPRRTQFSDAVDRAVEAWESAQRVAEGLAQARRDPEVEREA